MGGGDVGDDHGFAVSAQRVPKYEGELAVSVWDMPVSSF